MLSKNVKLLENLGKYIYISDVKKKPRIFICDFYVKFIIYKHIISIIIIININRCIFSVLCPLVLLTCHTYRILTLFAQNIFIIVSCLISVL